MAVEKERKKERRLKIKPVLFCATVAIETRPEEQIIFIAVVIILKLRGFLL